MMEHKFADMKEHTLVVVEVASSSSLGVVVDNKMLDIQLDTIVVDIVVGKLVGLAFGRFEVVEFVL